MDKITKHVVVGCQGMIGQKLFRQLKEEGGEVIGVARDAKESGVVAFDLGSSYNPDLPIDRNSVVYICAGISNLELCEQSPEETKLINVDAIKRLISYVDQRGGHVVYLSTSQIFDGKLRDDETASQEPNPQNEYGRQKWAVEQFIHQSGYSVSIIRLSKVLSHDLKDNFDNWIQCLRAGEEIQPAANMWLSPVWLDQVLLAMRTLGEGRLKGRWNLSASDQLSYADSIKFIASKLKLDTDLIKSTKVTENRVPEKFRPLITVMDSTALFEETGVEKLSTKDVLLRLAQRYQ